MNTETGEIFPARTKQQQDLINKLIHQGEPLVQISERAAQQQLAGHQTIREALEEQRATNPRATIQEAERRMRSSSQSERKPPQPPIIKDPTRRRR